MEIFAPAKVDPVPAYRSALKLIPLELTVQATFVWATLRPTAFAAAVSVDPFNPNMILPESEKTNDPFDMVFAPTFIVKLPPPAAAADKDKVNPADPDAVVPFKFVKFNVGFPWLCVEFAKVLLDV